MVYNIKQIKNRHQFAFWPIMYPYGTTHYFKLPNYAFDASVHTAENQIICGGGT